jgi:hypothetical protein
MIKLINLQRHADAWGDYSSTEVQKDNIHPKHYKGKVQPIDLIEAQNLNFAKGSIVKYVCRAGRKENELADLKKALYYLNLEIQKLENK